MKIVSRCFCVAKYQIRSEFFFSEGLVDEETSPIVFFVLVGAALAVVAPHRPIMTRLRLTSSHI